MRSLARYPLLDALRDRRSRCFGVGIAMDSHRRYGRFPASRAIAIP